MLIPEFGAGVQRGCGGRFRKRSQLLRTWLVLRGLGGVGRRRHDGLRGRRIGNGILTEVAQAGEDFFPGFANGVDAPLERGEDFGVDGGGLAEGEIGIGVEAILVDVGVEFGLGAA